MADDYVITTRSEGLLGQIGRWGVALISDEEMLEAIAAHDAEKRAEWEAARLAEQCEGEHVFVERYGMHHAKFGGIGGDAMSLTITREAWKSLGEPDVLAVSWVPVNENGA